MTVASVEMPGAEPATHLSCQSFRNNTQAIAVAKAVAAAPNSTCTMS